MALRSIAKRQKPAAALLWQLRVGAGAARQFATAEQQARRARVCFSLARSLAGGPTARCLALARTHSRSSAGTRQLHRFSCENR